MPAGKTVSLVGERGCGKSSTIELMKRSYDPEQGSGTITVNGKEFSKWNVRSFRRCVSVVSQKIDLFYGTIKENVLYGLSDAERLARGFDGPEAMSVGEAELVRVARPSDRHALLVPLLSGLHRSPPASRRAQGAPRHSHQSPK